MEMPTATKKTAAKKSRSGARSFSIMCRAPDSATSAPMMNAPSATEYPNAVASSAAANASPTVVTSVVSSRRSRATDRTKRGTTSRPMPMSAARNVTSCRTVPPISRRESALPWPSAERAASNRMAIRSSKTRMPKTVSRTTGSIGRSWKARAMIVVDEMATMAPVNTLSTADHPSSSATTTPRPNMALVSSRATSPETGASRSILRSENSRPMENISRTMPTSASEETVAASAMRGTGTCGPTIMPASR